MKYIFSLITLLAVNLINGQRIVIPLNEGWQFTKDKYVPAAATNSASWQSVSLPHTWNVEDVMDDEPGYYRGEAWYKRVLSLDKKLKGKEIFLCFEGANQQCTVFINGQKAGEHIGGYTAFTIPVTSLINWEKENIVSIKVDNSYNKNIPPLTADFTFYGGLYRQVSLLATDAVHFYCNGYGSKGVFIATPVVDKKTAVVQINGTITGVANKKVKIISTIYDAKGKLIASVSNTIVSTNTFQQSIKPISNPILWSPDNPYLYKIITRIVSSTTGKILDEVSNSIGFRWFRFDAEKGFFLNDQPLKLVGTSRHQDYKGMGNAVPPKLARQDVELLKEMGGNFLRVAHYPQDDAVLKACDELGIITSVEIPIVNEITESDSFYSNCEKMQVEMIRQNYNHPSIVMWCYMNEVLLKPQFGTDKERQKIYFASIKKLAATLDSLTRKEDPYRYTMMAHHGDYNRYKEVGLIDIPMLVGWNLYSGWYGANLNDFPAFLDKFHKEYPGKPVMVTEYGADADPRIRSTEPLRFDKSVEYTTLYHRFYLKEMNQRPFVAAAMIWNLADFNSETRVESMPHINNKGLLEWDRTPKDPYYYYKAMLSTKPFVKILGTASRGCVADSNSTFSLQTIQVAGNVAAIELFINGKTAGRKKVDNGIAEWKIPLTNGINVLKAVAIQQDKLFTDEKEIAFQLQPYELQKQPFQQLNILLGAKRYFTDKDNQLWLPDQPYHHGSWGHIGGKAFKMVNNGRLPYGTDKNIKGTDDDPVYQTQQIGIQEYRVDAEDGDYELTLYFSELLGSPSKQLIYNLDTVDMIQPSGQRIFSVWVNDKLLLENFNITEAYGPAVAVKKTISLSIRNNNGIDILFKPVIGEPVLNAVQVKRINVVKPE